MPEKHFYLRNIIQTKDNLRLSDKSKETLSETKAVNTVDAYESDSLKLSELKRLYYFDIWRNVSA